MTRAYKISDEALEFIRTESANHFPNETGGILVGRIESAYVIIQHATGPGPDAHHMPSRFKRDGEYSQEVLDTLVQDSGGGVDYIGEWHSHPFRVGPSPLDFGSMSWIAANDLYVVDEPVMLLNVRIGANCWKIRCYSLSEGKLRLLKAHN